SDAVEQYLHKVVKEFRAGELCEPQSALRHTRTRDGGRDERNRAIRLYDPFRRNIPAVLRFRTACRSACGPSGATSDIRLYARFDWARRRRADASIGRTYSGTACHSRPYGDTPVRRSRGARGMACGTEEYRWADRVRTLSAEGRRHRP